MLNKLKTLAKQFKNEFKVYQLIWRHPKTPKLAKFLLGLAIAYALMPFDLIPDFIPILGQLDDLVIVPFLVYLALKLIPHSVVSECREEMKREISA